MVDAVRGPLSQLGFKKRSGEIFTVDVESGVLGWLGLNHAYRRGEDRLEVNPVVGVRHQGVEHLVAELRGAKSNAYLPPTVSVPLGYLTADRKYVPWLFERGPTTAEVAADLTSAVARFGVPFMKASSSLSELRRLIEENTGFAHQLVYRQPVVCLLSGDRGAALCVLEASLAELGGRKDPAAVSFRSFAERFRDRVDQVA
jgi:hypothetical protein